MTTSGHTENTPTNNRLSTKADVELESLRNEVRFLSSQVVKIKDDRQRDTTLIAMLESANQERKELAHQLALTKAAAEASALAANNEIEEMKKRVKEATDRAETAEKTFEEEKQRLDKRMYDLGNTVDDLEEANNELECELMDARNDATAAKKRADEVEKQLLLATTKANSVENQVATMEMRMNAAFERANSVDLENRRLRWKYHDEKAKTHKGVYRGSGMVPIIVPAARLGTGDPKGTDEGDVFPVRTTVPRDLSFPTQKQSRTQIKILGSYVSDDEDEGEDDEESE